jgi:hypothetical protein
MGDRCRMGISDDSLGRNCKSVQPVCLSYWESGKGGVAPVLSAPIVSLDVSWSFLWLFTRTDRSRLQVLYYTAQPVQHWLPVPNLGM